MRPAGPRRAGGASRGRPIPPSRSRGGLRSLRLLGGTADLLPGALARVAATRDETSAGTRLVHHSNREGQSQSLPNTSGMGIANAMRTRQETVPAARYPASAARARTLTVPNGSRRPRTAQPGSLRQSFASTAGDARRRTDVSQDGPRLETRAKTMGPQGHSIENSAESVLTKSAKTPTGRCCGHGPMAANLCILSPRVWRTATQAPMITRPAPD
jgi:hypothetical protein